MIKTYKIIGLYLPLIFCAIKNNICAQISIREDSVIIGEILHVSPANMLFENFGEGPIIKGFFTVINTTPDTITFNDSNTEVSYCFFLNKKKRQTIAFLSSACHTTTIAPGDSLQICAEASLFLHPPIMTVLNYHIVDFSPTINKIQKTLIFKIKYANAEWRLSVKKLSISKNYLIDYSPFGPHVDD